MLKPVVNTNYYPVMNESIIKFNITYENIHTKYNNWLDLCIKIIKQFQFFQASNNQFRNYCKKIRYYLIYSYIFNIIINILIDDIFYIPMQVSFVIKIIYLNKMNYFLQFSNSLIICNNCILKIVRLKKIILVRYTI